jgi:hypothetical protein
MNKKKPPPEVCTVIPLHIITDIFHLPNAIGISTNDGLNWYTKQILIKQGRLVGQFMADLSKVFASVFVVFADNDQDNPEDRDWWIDSIWTTRAEAEKCIERLTKPAQPTLEEFAKQLFDKDAITDYSRYVTQWQTINTSNNYRLEEWALDTDKQPEEYDEAANADTLAKQKDDEQYYSNFT